MTPENDILLTRLTVRLQEVVSLEPIGSGLIFVPNNTGEHLYIFTAAHCLFEDSDAFQIPREKICVAVFNPATTSYETIIVDTAEVLTGLSDNRDLAIIVVERKVVERITGPLPQVRLVKERNSITTFVLKGFPSATKARELVTTRPVFNQEMPDEKKFQLLLTDDFSTASSAAYKVDGFSGSGVFLEDHGSLYLLGIFTRFRDAQKVIYCEYAEAINDILEANYFPVIPLSYVGEYGLTPEFFERHNNVAIKNLGPRFSEILNLKLPIAEAFDVIAKNRNFKKRLIKPIDKWLSGGAYSEYPTISDIANAQTSLKIDVVKWLQNVPWDAAGKIELAQITSRVDELNKLIDKKTMELYRLQREEVKQKREVPIEKKYEYQTPPYEHELHSLRELERLNTSVVDALADLSVQLANSPILIINGAPGCGKSHLLGDIALEANKTGTARVLLLGQLFSSVKSVWQNIADQMGLNCSKEQLLQALDNIGRQQGSRVLIMIDALNEGPGKDLWKDALPGFIEDILRFSHIGLAVTIRTTYFSKIVSKALQNDPRISYWEHEGFKGNEYAALRLFCEYYGLITPNFPILSPEFTNPLFLQLICHGIASSGRKSFPQGFQGMTSIFNFYLDALYNKLVEKRELYQNKKHLLREAILTFAEACFSKEGTRALSIEEADELFYQKFPRLPDLLNDFIHENVFIQNTLKAESEDEKEILYFAYERFGDFFMAELLLEPINESNDALKAFNRGNNLGKLINGYWRNEGLLEAMAVRIPEKFGLEIFEVFEWAFTTKGEQKHYSLEEWLGNIVWDSLKWRTTSSINDKKIIQWLQKYPHALREENWLLGLVELTTVHDHPFNGDRLFKNLIRHPMPQRDAFWQPHTRYYSGVDDSSNPFPLRRLLDWAWQPGISEKADPETARLAAQSLAWLLSSTNRKLRDQATKALVNLLEQHPQALLKILSAFHNIDDLYILERLYAVAYGCALRTKNHTDLRIIAQYVFDVIFSNANPPVHVLLRDYARNTVEYAFSLGLLGEIDISLARPPYSSHFPDILPDLEDIKVFESDISDEDPEHIRENKRIKGKIHFSTLHWDFGRYTVNSAVSGFSPLSFTLEKEFRIFRRKLKQGQRTKISIIDKVIECHYLLQSKRDDGVRYIGERTIEDWLQKTESELDDFLSLLKTDLDAETYQVFFQSFLPFLRAKHEKVAYHDEPENREGIKRWIVKRAHELGYDYELHGEFDYSVSRYRERDESGSERIGKKYQWIALHEMVSMLGDNFYFHTDRWRSDRKLSVYQGPWQHYLRDIDPIYITKNGEEENVDEPEIMEGWWFNTGYSYWNQPGSAWVNNKNDLPAPQQIICCKDELGEEWVYLKINCKWREPKPLGQDRYSSLSKEILYMINAYLVRKKDKARMIKWMAYQNFFGRWMPESRDSPTGLFNRENYWSPASHFNAKEYKVWERVDGISAPVIVTVHAAVGEMSDDKSGAHSRFHMPCKYLFEGMGLQYAAEDGSFQNRNGEVVVRHFSPWGMMVKKEELVAFLNEEELEIVWTLLGEKNMFSGMGGNNNLFRAINGVYYWGDNGLTGTMSITSRDKKNAH